MLKIISGKFRGRTIGTSSDISFRPTTTKMREAIFSILYSMDQKGIIDLDNANLLELYAGSGIFSFEALSRGVKQATLVDNSNSQLNKIRQNAQNLEIDGNISCVNSDATELPDLGEEFDLVFIDPPYHKNLLYKTLNSLLEKQCLKPDSYIFIESLKTTDITPPEQFELSSIRKYGGTKLTILHKYK